MPKGKRRKKERKKEKKKGGKVYLKSLEKLSLEIFGKPHAHAHFVKLFHA